MASTPHHYYLPMHTLILSISLFVFLPILPLTTCNSIHDLLRSRGLPAGLFPQNVKSYDLDQNDYLQVYLEEPCEAKFENRVFFESVVKANLSYGGLIGLEGLSQEELFLWLPVKGIKVIDPLSGLILFDIGLAFKQLSLSLFEEPPICVPKVSLKCSWAVGELWKEGVGISKSLKTKRNGNENKGWVSNSKCFVLVFFFFFLSLFAFGFSFSFCFLWF
ncbi:uncharacterized protein LOC111904850 isoform X1 [Lactuca sativa]|uniref:uncharacterized protein LOC111904850 isoform X1 n=1 Tax=Lactuca sativa TaxID=4236 RepID=UPI0022AE77E0|nr:uncharacterized protein LOC111904850 isoform X1 [Lactuca sativa]